MTRDEAIQVIRANGLFYVPNNTPTFDMLTEAFDMAIEALEEALERKHGEWIEVYEDYRQQISWWECSVCKCGISWLSNFCPECGADMRGEEDVD